MRANTAFCYPFMAFSWKKPSGGQGLLSDLPFCRLTESSDVLEVFAKGNLFKYKHLYLHLALRV